MVTSNFEKNAHSINKLSQKSRIEITRLQNVKTTRYNELINQIKSYNRFLDSESLKGHNFALEAHQNQKEEGVPYNSIVAVKNFN